MLSVNNLSKISSNKPFLIRYHRFSDEHPKFLDAYANLLGIVRAPLGFQESIIKIYLNIFLFYVFKSPQLELLFYIITSRITIIYIR